MDNETPEEAGLAYTANIMPQDFGGRLFGDDLAAIIAYIRSLG